MTYNLVNHTERDLDILLQTSRLLGGLWGAVVGDALGVPVEFRSRDEVRREPVEDMRGQGTFNLPPGSWSDDSSLTLCTVQSLLGGLNVHDMAERFLKWRYNGYWTPYGEAFDIGRSTDAAMEHIRRGGDSLEAGGAGEYDNGNGSLMRILPVALKFHNSLPGELVHIAHRVSSITHRHPRSRMACGMYCIMAASLLHGDTPVQAYEKAITSARELYSAAPFVSEIPHFARFLAGGIGDLKEEEIASSGYVVHTLEAGTWCLLNTKSYSKAVLAAVNLGEDTDTTACVTGGLAGLAHGVERIPAGWINVLARRDDIRDLFRKFVESC